MRRYIDADKLEADLLKHKEEANKAKMCLTENDFADLIHDAETADVEPVRHGHWKLIPCVCSGLDIVTYECSSCEKYVHLFDDEDIYESCPHCGAKMDEEIIEV